MKQYILIAMAALTLASAGSTPASAGFFLFEKSTWDNVAWAFGKENTKRNLKNAKGGAECVAAIILNKGTKKRCKDNKLAKDYYKNYPDQYPDG